MGRYRHRYGLAINTQGRPSILSNPKRLRAVLDALASGDNDAVRAVLVSAIQVRRPHRGEPATYLQDYDRTLSDDDIQQLRQTVKRLQRAGYGDAIQLADFAGYEEANPRRQLLDLATPSMMRLIQHMRDLNDLLNARYQLTGEATTNATLRLMHQAHLHVHSQRKSVSHSHYGHQMKILISPSDSFMHDAEAGAEELSARSNPPRQRLQYEIPQVPSTVPKKQEQMNGADVPRLGIDLARFKSDCNSWHSSAWQYAPVTQQLDDDSQPLAMLNMRLRAVVQRSMDAQDETPLRVHRELLVQIAHDLRERGDEHLLRASMSAGYGNQHAPLAELFIAVQDAGKQCVIQLVAALGPATRLRRADRVLDYWLSSARAAGLPQPHTGVRDLVERQQVALDEYKAQRQAENDAWRRRGGQAGTAKREKPKPKPTAAFTPRWDQPANMDLFGQQCDHRSYAFAVEQSTSHHGRSHDRFACKACAAPYLGDGPRTSLEIDIRLHQLARQLDEMLSLI